MRSAAVLALLLSFAATSCDEADHKPCSGEADETTCAQGETCVWLNSDGHQAYACAATCNTSADCTGGGTCRTDAASSCMICHDLLGVCE